MGTIKPAAKTGTEQKETLSLSQAVLISRLIREKKSDADIVDKILGRDPSQNPKDIYPAIADLRYQLAREKMVELADQGLSPEQIVNESLEKTGQSKSLDSPVRLQLAKFASVFTRKYEQEKMRDDILKEGGDKLRERLFDPNKGVPRHSLFPPKKPEKGIAMGGPKKK